ncbi:MAG: hypothetical protein GF365_02090 [Candidatus Buchananbacteria bacterium]|nr:hypothetical protein [Candidatus Buchananbacteria bacterium]
MIFGKKQKKEKKSKQEEKNEKPKSSRAEPYEIRVMPPKFHEYLTQSKGGVPKWLIFAGIGFVVLAGIGIGAYYLLIATRPPSQPPARTNTNQPTVNTNQANTNANANENANTNINENINVNENANINVNENVNANVNVNTNVNENVNANENVNTNANININQPPETDLDYFSSQDSDRDGLTDVEENLYETEIRRPDTDADGFVDGQEIINGFNPKAAGSSLLMNSGLVNTYSNPTFNYQILYLATWVARPTDQSLQEIVFQSATGERVVVLVEANPDNLSLPEWYLQQSSLSNISDLESETTRKGYQVLISPDKLTYYLVDQQDLSTVYIINYQIDNKTSINFLTTFKMMVNSFELAEATETEETATETEG